MTKKVQWMVLVFGLSMMAACATGSGSNNSGVVDKTQAIVLDCSNGWTKCVSAANKICGSAGFDEIDRMQDMHMTASGRLEDQQDGRLVYRDDVRLENQQQTMVIRCK